MKKKLIFSYLVSFLMVSLYSYAFFRNVIFSVLLGVLSSIKIKDLFLSYFENENFKEKRLMFKEFLDLLNSNILASQNLYLSLLNVSKEMGYIFQKNSFFLKILQNLVSSIENGSSMENALTEFKENLKIKEADIFIDTLIISIQSGIDISKVTSFSKTMLIENISLELEMGNMINDSKREFLIMSTLPLLILFLINSTSALRLSFVDYLIRSIVFFLFVFAFFLGYKIINLEEK